MILEEGASMACGISNNLRFGVWSSGIRIAATLLALAVLTSLAGLAVLAQPVDPAASPAAPPSTPSAPRAAGIDAIVPPVKRVRPAAPPSPDPIAGQPKAAKALPAAGPLAASGRATSRCPAGQTLLVATPRRARGAKAKTAGGICVPVRTAPVKASAPRRRRVPG